MMHTFKFSLRTGRPRVLLHETSVERCSWDTEGAKLNANLREGEGVLVGAPLPIVWISGHPRMHELQLMASRYTGRIPRHVHPEVLAFVHRRIDRPLLEVNDRYVSVDRKGRIVAAYYADHACGDKAPNPAHRMIEHGEADERWDFRRGVFVPTRVPIYVVRRAA